MVSGAEGLSGAAGRRWRCDCEEMGGIGEKEEQIA